MTPTQTPELRREPRHGVALRVLLGNDPPMHATTRNISLGGMYLMTATRALPPGRAFTATLEVDCHGRTWATPLPVHVIWSNDTSAGVAFRTLPADTVMALREILDEARTRHKQPHAPRECA